MTPLGAIMTKYRRLSVSNHRRSWPQVTEAITWDPGVGRAGSSQGLSAGRVDGHLLPVCSRARPWVCVSGTVGEVYGWVTCSEAFTSKKENGCHFYPETHHSTSPMIKQRKSRDVVVNTYNRGPEKQFSDLPRYFSYGLILSALTGEPENVLQGRVQPRLRDWWDLIRWKQTTVAKSEVIRAPRIHRRAIFYPSVWSQWLRTWCGCSAEYILRACCIPDTTQDTLGNLEKWKKNMISFW